MSSAYKTCNLYAEMNFYMNKKERHFRHWCLSPLRTVLLAFGNVKEIGAVVERPKALGDIRGVSYIYGMFCRFGLITVPTKNEKT